MERDPGLYINRELSWLEFNARVLHEAFDPRNRLLERLKFLSIFSSNLDEFYMVRVAGLRRQLVARMEHRGPDGMSPAEQLEAIATRVASLRRDEHRCLYDVLLPELATQGIKLIAMQDLTAAETDNADRFFREQISPILTPLALDTDHPFPYISNLSLCVALQIFDPASEASRFARFKVPRRLPRWVSFGRANHFVPLEQVIRAYIDRLFPHLEIRGYSTFRVIRYSDFDVFRAGDDDDLLTTIEEQIFQRRFAEIIRVDVEDGMPPELRALLLEELRDSQPPEMPELTDSDLVEAGPLLDLGDLIDIATLDIPELRDPPFTPVTPAELQDASRPIFDAIRERDILVHHPFDSFETTVERFITTAAADEDVLAIKITLYRTSGDTEIVRALGEAAQRGKRVAVLIELKARFDEVNNIGWARTLEGFGVNVGFGLPNLKTHAKIAVVLRREADGIRRYVHIGTGNYNAETAQVYTDVGMFTSDQAIGADLTDLFNALTGYQHDDAYTDLLVAPANMRSRFTAMVNREADHARAGRPARIIVKMNALVDPDMIAALYDASRAGVQIDLIVRGICCLRPKVPGVSDRINVISIIGRFLEHSRIFYFANGGREEFYLGSADWMPRNFDRRVEVVTPIQDARLHSRVFSLLETCLADNRLAWDLAADGTYVQRKPGKAPVRSTHEKLLTNSWGLEPASRKEGTSGRSARGKRAQSAAPTSSS
ncbi:MAG: polyphosphate kinase 1 [Gemmatimonadaceae bacterium]